MNDKDADEWKEGLINTLDGIAKDASEQSLINAAVAVSDTLKIILREDVIENSTHKKILESFIDVVHRYKKLNGTLE